jgi:predicted dehydrogenase
VACLLGSGSETLEPARRDLFEQTGSWAQGYTSVEEMLARESLDALVILSPAETHETYLRAAAEAGLHALCEKPLVWGAEGLAERATASVDRFRSRGLLLAENCQWPYALPAFRELHPGVLSGPPRTFGMRLSPVSTGEQVLADCLAHPLSLLQALAPAATPTVDRIRYTPLRPDTNSLQVRFDYSPNGARVEVDLELRNEGAFPRAASLEIDGYRADRVVHMPGYALSFSDGDRTVPLKDPLTERIRGFVDDLRAVVAGGSPPDPTPLVERMAMMETLLDAYRIQLDDPETADRSVTSAGGFA